MATLVAIRMSVFNGASDGAVPSMGDDCKLYLSNSTFNGDTPITLNSGSSPGFNVTGRTDTLAMVNWNIAMAKYGSGVGAFAYNFAAYAKGGGGADPAFFTAGLGAQSSIPLYWRLLGINKELQLHLDSPMGILVPACFHLAGASQLLPTGGSDASFTTVVVPYMVSCFKKLTYFKIGGRPVVFCYNPPGQYGGGDPQNFSTRAAFATGVANLRAACAAASNPAVGDPLIYGLSADGADISSYMTGGANDVGLDGGGDYTAPAATSAGMTAANFHAAEVTKWGGLVARYGTNAVPSCTFAHNNQRFQTLRRDGVTASGWAPITNYSADPTPAAWAAQVIAARAWTVTNNTDTGIVVASAWDEHDIKWFSPTYSNKGLHCLAMAKAMGTQGDRYEAYAARFGRTYQTSRA